jgi:diguanylate cyclase (GGDEF)-like protein
MIRKRLGAAREHIAVDGDRVDVGVSAGIALYPDDGRDADSLIRHADAAMYSAKRNGRSMVFA